MMDIDNETAVLSLELQRALVAEAARAPSVHNVQPARWRFDRSGVVLLEDLSRRLPAADPSAHDIGASLGAAFEGMSIALSRHGLTLALPSMIEGSDSARYRPVARADIVSTGRLDPLADWVERRRAWRGAFTPIDDEQRAALIRLATQRDDIAIGLTRASVDESARLNDACSWEFLRRHEYQAELFDWMRLSPSHANWNRDGLNADCLAMSAVERTAARVLFRPRMFRALGKIGLARPLIAEAARVRSAGAIVVVHRPANEPAFDTGRAFYRLWLELTARGLVACPMSSISDSPIGSASVRRQFELPSTRRIVNVLRVGRSPAAPPESPRLPVDELVVSREP